MPSSSANSCNTTTAECATESRLGTSLSPGSQSAELTLPLNVDYESLDGEEKLSRIGELLLGLARNGRWVGKAIVQAGPQRPVRRNNALIKRPCHVPVVVPVGEELARTDIPIPVAPHAAQHAGEGEQIDNVLLVEELVVVVVGRDEPGVGLDAATRLGCAPGHDKEPLEPLVANAARIGGQVHARPPILGSRAAW